MIRKVKGDNIHFRTTSYNHFLKGKEKRAPSTIAFDMGTCGYDPIQRDKVLQWIAANKDLPALAELYRLTGEGYSRIQPELGKEAECLAVRNLSSRMAAAGRP